MHTTHYKKASDLGTDKVAGTEDRHNEIPASVNSIQQVVLHAVVDVQQVVSVGPSIANKLIRQRSVKY